MRNLEVNDVIKISGIRYSVKGYIVFNDAAQGSKWTEYKLSNSSNIVWLSVDEDNKEYVLSDEALTGREYDRQVMELFMGGEEDRGSASVIKARGAVDVDLGDRCRYYEIFDRTDQYVISQEIWEDEVEYSRGRSISLSCIEIEEKNSSYLDKEYDYEEHNHKKKMMMVLVGAIVVIIIGIFIGSGGLKEKDSLSRNIKRLYGTGYETTITGDTYTDLKADVYRTYESVGEATDRIMTACSKEIETVNSDEDKEIISILTQYEYAVIYKGEDGITYIQVSSREYNYANNNILFMGIARHNQYYRGHYYQYGYDRDRQRYTKRRSAYESFVPLGILYKEYRRDKDKDYNSWGSSSSSGSGSSGSIRRSSSGTRSSGSGGISSGK
ncbi:MAG: DUF4178 domain-containing protein [Cellulosilyticaceae bacterium]